MFPLRGRYRGVCITLISSRLVDDRWVQHVVGRSPDDLQLLILTLEAEPGKWFIYSTHISKKSAGVRASRLRRHPPNALVAVHDSLEFETRIDGEHGPVVLVRWVPPS